MESDLVAFAGGRKAALEEVEAAEMVEGHGHTGGRRGDGMRTHACLSSSCFGISHWRKQSHELAANSVSLHYANFQIILNFSIQVPFGLCTFLKVSPARNGNKTCLGRASYEYEGRRRRMPWGERSCLYDSGPSADFILATASR